MVGVQARKEQAIYAVQRGLSQRRACTLLSIGRASLSDIARMPVKDSPVVTVMKRLSAKYPRFGYRRINILLAREGLPMSIERCARIWRDAGLQVPKKSKRRVNRECSQSLQARHPTSVWSDDFVHDACANGQKLKCLTVIDVKRQLLLPVDDNYLCRSPTKKLVAFSPCT